MEKPVRYFNQPGNDSEGETNRESWKKPVVFDVTKLRKRSWGRRQEDRKNGRAKLKGRPFNPNPTYKRKGQLSKEQAPKERLEQFNKGPGVNLNSVKTSIYRKRIQLKEKNVKFATEQAAKTHVLLTEEAGYLEAGDGETTTQFTQKQILDSIDVAAAAKAFELNLEFGPYRSKYTRNGRHLLIGGTRGHVAAFDWVTKKLHCEINVMESVYDICWLHLETMFAVAQKNWVYIYDNQGIELHCIKKLNMIRRMEFLPYHFLLATGSDNSYLSWLDVSIGQVISQYNTGLGQHSTLVQNPWNATLCLGHAKGVVSLWAPTSKDPLAKILCHKAPITALHVDPSGTYMASAANNRDLKLWDIRKLEGPIQEFKLVTAANNLAFSQKRLLAVGMENVVQIYKDCDTNLSKRPYLRQRFPTTVSNFNFCPYEDVLGVSTAKGFVSLLVPGAGEAHFDSMEANPYQSKTQRREAEVKALLEKIQPEMITLDPTIIADVDVATLRDKVDAKKKLIHLKVPKIKYEPRKKAKGKGGSVKMAKNKKIMQEEAKKQHIKEKSSLLNNDKKVVVKSNDVLNRFLPTKRKI